MKDFVSRVIFWVKQKIKDHPGCSSVLIGIIVLFPGVYFKLSEFLLAITALIIFFYTVETYKMRRAITESTELNTRPILTLEIDFVQERFAVRNFSNFPAYNFRIEEYNFEQIENVLSKVFKNIAVEEGSSPIIYGEFKGVDVIPPKGEGVILEKGDSIDFFEALKPSPFKANIVIFKAVVSYDDILNNSWKMTIGYGDGRIIATKPEKIR